MIRLCVSRPSAHVQRCRLSCHAAYCEIGPSTRRTLQYTHPGRAVCRRAHQINTNIVTEDKSTVRKAQRSHDVSVSFFPFNGGLIGQGPRSSSREKTLPSSRRTNTSCTRPVKQGDAANQQKQAAQENIGQSTTNIHIQIDSAGGKNDDRKWRPQQRPLPGWEMLQWLVSKLQWLMQGHVRYGCNVFLPVNLDPRAARRRLRDTSKKCYFSRYLRVPTG